MSASPGRIASKKRPGRRSDATERPASAPSGAPVLIKTRGLTKEYDDLVAVDHLDLDIRAGEIFVQARNQVVLLHRRLLKISVNDTVGACPREPGATVS